MILPQLEDIELGLNIYCHIFCGTSDIDLIYSKEFEFVVV